MKGFFKWFSICLGGLLTLGLLSLGTIYTLSNRALNQQYEYTLTDFKVASSDSNLVIEGARLAKVHGCSNGCHGAGGRGQKWLDLSHLQVTSPNLPRIFKTYTDAELERSIRGGIKADGTSVVFMPSPEYYYFSDHDLSAIIAYFRSLSPEESEGPAADFNFGWETRYKMSKGEFKFAAKLIAQQGPRATHIDPNNPMQFGQYLAETSCGGCHGPDFMGGKVGSGPTPSLKIIAAYSEAEFARFMTTGIAKGERETRMSNKARKSFSHLTANELTSLYAYLSAFAKAPLAASEVE